MNDLLPIIIGSVLGPILTYYIKKIPAVCEVDGGRFGAAINMGVCVILAVAVGAVLPLAYPELPRDLETWTQIGLAAGGAGAAGNNILRKTVFAKPKPRALKDRPRKARGG